MVAYILLGIFAVLFLLAALVALAGAIWRLLASLIGTRPQHIHAAPANPRVVITLVHGTFARGAAWTRPGSALCTALLALFGPATALHSFSWSGYNSVVARRRASATLKTQIEERVRAHPGARHFLIGHSHGGSVIMGALDQSIASRIAGIVCLATPFLHVHERPRRGSANTALFFVPFVLVAFLLIGLEEAYPMLSDDAEGLLVLVALAVAGLIASWVKRQARRVAATQDLSFLTPDRLLLVRAPGDEASNAIGMAHLLSAVFGTLSMLPVRLFDRVQSVTERWRAAIVARKGWAALAALLLLGVSIAWFVDLLSDSVSDDAPVFFWLGFACLLVLLGLFALLTRGGIYVYFVAHMVMAIALVPFAFFAGVLGLILIGPELTLTALLLEVSAEPCPTGTWRIMQLPPEDRDGLRHSIPYQSETALQAIGQFLSSRQPVGSGAQGVPGAPGTAIG